MKKDLVYVSTKNMTEEDWLRHRQNGLGASEIGKVMGVSEWGSAHDLFYQKIGETLDYSIENIATFMGKYDEPKVANLWQYWGGNEESMIKNYIEKRIVRRMRKINAYVSNPKWPWLFCSLDRIINKTPTRGEGALELKTIGGWEAKKWDAGVPPSYLLQVIDQVGICEFEYGELATLQDGRKMDVLPIEHNKSIFENVIDVTHDFWQNVIRGRTILTQRFEANGAFNMRLVEELNQELQELEPEPDGSRGFADFITDKYSEGTKGERTGTILELDRAKKHRKLKEDIKNLSEELRTHENYLKNEMRDFTKLSFGNDGSLTWSGSPRKFINRVKI